MARELPATGLCAVCYRPIIDATITSEAARVRLDAEPDPAGDYRAFLCGALDAWVASRYKPGGPFEGLRRREHTCPDTQLTL